MAVKNTKTDEENRTGRMAAFSDAIFAFAMTLLLFDLKTPDIPNGLGSEGIMMWVAGLAPMFIICVLSFLVIGSFWITHHRMFEYIKRYDHRLMWMNIFFLLLISLMPLPTALLGEYGQDKAAAIIYALYMAVTGLVLTYIWKYATDGRRHCSADISQKDIGLTTRRGLAVSAVFLLSVPVAFFSASIAELSWLLILLVRNNYT